MVHAEIQVAGKMKKYIKYENTEFGVFPFEYSTTGSWLPRQNGKPEYLPSEPKDLWNKNNLYHRMKLAKYKIKPDDEDVFQDLHLNYQQRMCDPTYSEYDPSKSYDETIKLVYESVYQNYYYHSLTPNQKSKYVNSKAKPEPVMERQVPLNPDIATASESPSDAAMRTLARIGHTTVNGWLRDQYKAFKDQKFKLDQVHQVKQWLKYRNIKFHTPRHGDGKYIYLTGCPICQHRSSTVTYLRRIPEKNVWTCDCENPNCKFTVPDSGHFVIHKKRFRLEWFLSCAVVLQTMLDLEDKIER